MPTESPEVDANCVLAAIAYLRRNDFKRIVQVDGSMLTARDGARLVYIWVCNDEPGGISVPTSFIRLAFAKHARVDVISIAVLGEKVTMKHLQNAVSVV